MSDLNIVSIYKSIAEKQKKKKETYQVFLRQCEKDIRRIASKSGLQFAYMIPEYKFGLPIYDINDCIRYVKTELEKGGFLVKYYFPNVLFISWDIRDLENDQKEENASPYAANPTSSYDSPYASLLAPTKPVSIMKDPLRLKKPTNTKFVLTLE